MPGFFEFPHRWTEIAPLLLADKDDPLRDQKVNQGVAFLDDRDRTVEDRMDFVHRPYTPSFTATGGGLNLGTTGSIVGSSVRMGTFVAGTAVVQFGGTGVNQGAGYYILALPYPPANTSYFVLGMGKLFAGGNSCMVTLQHDFANLGYLRALYLGAYPVGAETVAGANAPWAWVAGNNLELLFFYQATLA